MGASVRIVSGKLIAAASLVALAACVNTPVNEADAKVVVGVRWENPPMRGFGGISFNAYPYDSATGAAGRQFVPNGQAHVWIPVERPGPSGINYEVKDVVAGSYVVGHFESDAGDTNITWACPPIAFSVRPNTVTYVGDFVFNGLNFVRFEQAYETAVASKAGGGGSLQRASLIDAKIDYSRYTNPGLMTGVPVNPCSSGSGA
jgi:hypothetical protein